MEDVQRALSHEVARILGCPYPASLTPLADILARADDRVVQACIHHLSQCAIARLASIVASSLSLWSYSLPILHALCHSSAFRDALLRDNPCLLDTLLAKANTSQREFDQYTNLCVLLLSRPLPSGVSLPASVQPFFLRLFDKATHLSDAIGLKHIYLCLNGACRGLLKLLSSEARQEFDSQLCGLLQLHAAGANPMLLLWCFGIIIIAECPEDVSSGNGLAAEPTKQWTTASARRLFEKQVLKTIDLTCLNVIWVTKEDVNVSENDVVEGIKIATRAMRFVDKSTRAKWLNGTDTARRCMAKLISKIQRPGIDPCVKFEALCFYATMAGAQGLREELVTEYLSLLLGLQNLESDPETLRDTLLNSLPLYARELSQSTIAQLLVNIFKSTTSSQHPSELQNTSILVDVLLDLGADSMSRELTMTLCSSELQEHFRDFLATPIETLGATETCDTSLNLLRRDVYTRTVSMLLTALISAGTNCDQSASAIGIALIKKQQQLPFLNNQCSHPKPIPSSKISLFEQACTPATGVQRQDWRDAIGSELERQSHYQRASVIRSVAQICQNLEDRCHSVEAPLRQEQARVKELNSVIAELREKIADMEAEAMDRQYFFNSLEAEIESGNKERAVLSKEKEALTATIEGLEAKTDDTNKEKDDLATRLEKLKADFDQANEEADEALFRLTENLKAKEAELRSTISAHEEALYSRDQEIGKFNARYEELEDELRRLQGEKSSLQGLYENLKNELSITEKDLQAERGNLAAKSEEMEQLTVRQSDLEERLATAEQRLESTIAQRDELTEQLSQFSSAQVTLEGRLATTNQKLNEVLNERNELQAQVERSEQTVQDLEARRITELDAASSKAKHELEVIQSKLQEAIAESEQARTICEVTMRELESAQDTVSRLEEEVQQLEDSCAEKDDELYELEAWREQMKALVSLDKPVSRRPNREPGHRKSSIKSTRLQKRKSTIPPEDMASAHDGIPAQISPVEDATSASLGSSQCSERNGSTPKRAKTRSFKVPDMHTPYRAASNLGRQSGTKQTHKRSALGTISPNRRHTSVGFALSRVEEDDGGERNTKRRGSLQVGTQALFDMDEMFPSSPFTPGNVICGTGKDPEEEETTITL